MTTATTAFATIDSTALTTVTGGVGADVNANANINVTADLNKPIGALDQIGGGASRLIGCATGTSTSFICSGPPGWSIWTAKVMKSLLIRLEKTAAPHPAMFRPTLPARRPGQAGRRSGSAARNGTRIRPASGLGMAATN